MPRPKFYSCILCKSRLNPKDRYKIKDSHIKILNKHFGVQLSSDNNFLCNRCRCTCYKIENKKLSKTVHHSQMDTADNDQMLPYVPKVTIDLPSTSSSHSYCTICKRPGPKMVVLQTDARVDAFVKSAILIPSGARCCPKHLENGRISNDSNWCSIVSAVEIIVRIFFISILQIQSTKKDIEMDATDLLDIIKESRELVLQKNKYKLDFDNIDSLSDDDYSTLTGLRKQQFSDLMFYLKGSDIKSSHSRSPRICVAILFVKLRCALSNKILATLFSMTKFQVRRAVMSARRAFKSHFVPQNLGFNHVSRKDIIDNHTRPLAKELLCPDIFMNHAILILDGTYIYVQKSGNFSRRSFSMHKHRPLVKPMMIVSSTGYIVSVLGPYLADPKNNDANILKHLMKTNAEEMKSWVNEGDIFVVDRGFRDAEDLLKDLGIQTEMPSFLQRGQPQHSTEEANNSRLITKIRWEVESAYGRLKTWRYLDKVLPNSQIIFIGDYVQIICAVINKYHPPISSGTYEDDIIVASKMRVLSTESNILKEFVEENGIDRREFKWEKMEVTDCSNFPRMTEAEIRNLTVGVYQVKMAKSYTHEHLTDDGSYEIMINSDIPSILCAKIQSRHISSKQYKMWINYSEGEVKGWFCKCKNGARVVGMCAHITSVVWYLWYARYDRNMNGVKKWIEFLHDAGEKFPVPEPIDESEHEQHLEE